MLPGYCDFLADDSDKINAQERLHPAIYTAPEARRWLIALIYLGV
jgi:hypothetical protein